MSAIAAGTVLGLSAAEINCGLAGLEMSKMRQETLSGLRGSVIINDAYNASPASMLASMHVRD